MKKRFAMTILSVMMFVCAVAFFVACTTESAQKEFTGFNVNASAQAEAGTEYVFETPEVMCEGKKADVSIAVSFGGKAIAHDGVKIYLENVGEYTITYTASCDGATDTRTTALTSTDTTAPIIASTLPQNLRMEYEIVLSDYIAIKEKSGIKQATYTVMDTTAETPAELEEGQFDAETTRLYLTDEAVEEITVHISVEDNVGLKSERDIVIGIMPLSPYGGLTFDHEWYTASVLGGNNMAYDVTTKQMDGYTAITSTFTGSWPSFSIESESLKTLAAFDYITLRHQVTYGIPGGWLGLEQQNYTTTYTSTSGDWTLRTWYKDNRGKPSEADAGDSIWSALAAGRLKILPTTGQNVETTFTLVEITGGFNDVVMDKGDSIDLIAKTGLAASEFTASFKAKGSDDTTPITDVTSFKPSSKGTILIAVDKEGFKETTLEIGITFTAEPAEYGNILNLNGYDAGDAYANVSGATATVIEDSVSGGKAIKVVNSGAASSTAIVTISGDAVKTIANFDYLVVKVRLSYTDAESQSVNIKITNADEWTKPNGQNYVASNGGNGTAHELIYDRIANSFTFDSETESFQIKLQKWNDAEQTTIITAIDGGYYDIEEDKETPIDLTEILGLQANEFTASYKAGDSTSATTIDDVTAFVPQQEGTIVIDVNKAGFAEATFEIGFLFTLEPQPYGQMLFDDGFRRCTATMEGKEGSSTKEYPVTVGEDGEYGVLTSTFKGGWPKFTVTSEELKAFASFDYITVRYKFTGGGWFGLEKDSYTTTYTTTDGDWTLRTWYKDNRGKPSASTAGEEIWAALAAGKLTMLPCSGTDGAEYTFTLAEITGGYCDVEVDKGMPIDIAEKLGLAENEFTASYRADGETEGTRIDNVTAFTPEKEGTLIIVVSKSGFAEAEFEIEVTFAPEPAKYGSILNLNGYDAGDVYADIAGAPATVIDDTVSGGKALQIVNSGGANAAAVMTISGDTVKTIASFDYFVIKARLLMDSAATNTNVNLQVSNVTGRPSWGDYAAATSGDGTEYEWVFDKVTNSFDFDSTTNSFTVTFKKWDAAKLTVIVTEISGGYYDIEAEEGQSVDLTAEFNLGTDEFTAQFTPENGETQNVEDLTAFQTASDGTLKITINKDGFAETEITVSVKILTESYGTFLFDDASVYTASVVGGNSVKYDVTTAVVDGYTAITSTFTGSYPIFTLTSDKLKAFAAFDYITLRYKAEYGAVGAWLGLEQNGYTTTDQTTDGEWQLYTWHRNDRYGKSGSGAAIWAALAAGELDIMPTPGSNVETTFTLAEISGGFYDVEGDGTTETDLTAKYGSGLVKAICTPEGGEAVTLEGDNLKTFVGESDGDLQLVFSVQGFKQTTFDLKYTVTATE